MTFSSYTSDRFTSNSQLQLLEMLENLAGKGVYVFASNSDTDYIRNLYRYWNITELRRKGTMSCKGCDRGKVAELLMSKSIA